MATPPLILDRIDVGLLRALQNNARLSNKELAASVGLAPSSTHTRLKRLEQHGALLGAHAEIARTALGIGLEAIIALRIRRHAPDAVSQSWATLCALPETVAAFTVGGDDDIMAHVATRGSDHLRELVMATLPRLLEVERLRTELIFDHFRRPPPLYREAP
jgi:DNA-binding Lrp family transcriptional regulator